MWILLKQEIVSGSDISWAMCKSAPRSRQITTPAPHNIVFTGRMPFLPPDQQHQSTEGTEAYQTQVKNLPKVHPEPESSSAALKYSATTKLIMLYTSL